MLDQLVESRNTSAENTRRSEFLLGTMVILVTVLVGAWVYSLFNKEYGMGTGDLDLGQLVAPVALPEDEPPPPPEPEKQPEEKSAPNPDKPTVVEKIATMEETRTPPKDLKGEVLKAPPLKSSEAKNYDVGTTNQGRAVEGQTYNDTPQGINPGGTGGGGNDDEGDAIVVKKATPTPAPTPKPAPKTISGGVVNGKATNHVKPPYPAAARAVRAAGAVNVQVTIDENGNVISASAVSGHPLLRAAAVQAARSSKFSPTMLSGQAVKVTGVIVYNFVP
jgi:periplasmic protein TonB